MRAVDTPSGGPCTKWRRRLLCALHSTTTSSGAPHARPPGPPITSNPAAAAARYFIERAHAHDGRGAAEEGRRRVRATTI